LDDYLYFDVEYPEPEAVILLGKNKFRIFGKNGND